MVTLSDIKRKATFEKIRSEIDVFVQAMIKDSKRRIAVTSDDGDEEDSEITSEQDTDVEDDEEQETDNGTVFRKMSFGWKEFNLLTEKIWFDSPGWLIKLDLFDGFLKVRCVPGDPHGVATAVFSELVIIWARDPDGMGLAANPLRGSSDASMFHMFSTDPIRLSLCR